MDSPRPAVDLEKELSCSICTELLYQPLTLLDCLHTFCGACLKEWFSWQATAAEGAPTPPATGAGVYTCPACRSEVRDTRHNATVATLLDMFIAANPEKDRSGEDKEEMRGRYRPGEKVLREVRGRSEGERRLDEEERRLLEEVRELSLREAVGGGRERRDGGHSGLRPEREEGRRRRRSGSRQERSGDESEGRSRRRHIEHQSSIRSLISAGGMSPRDIDREIEDFARQIQEEGLLEGLDLDNIDLSNNDELSRKITEAYRRRQRQRSRHEARRRSNGSGHSHHSDPVTPENRSYVGGSSSRTGSRQRPGVDSRSSSQTGQAVDDRSRPPTSSGGTHLEVQEPRRRRRTTSGGRSATVPVVPPPETRVAARSQTDLSLRTHDGERSGRPVMASEGRSTSTPTMTTGMTESPATQGLPFRARAAAAASTGLGILPPQPTLRTQTPPERRHRPAEIQTTPPLLSATTTSPPSPSLSSPPLLSPASQQKRTRHLYPEPSITCKRCARPHIQYDLHYNCGICHAGAYNICLDCYRRGKGCLHWFGFGYGAWTKWDKARAANPRLEPPHMLTANRYQRPKTTPGGAEGRVTLTAQDPAARLESGTFCARCTAWSNECFWRCDVCNEGDWGFCDGCVNTGRCCSHALLPLTYDRLDTDDEGRTGPKAGKRPVHAVVGEQAIGPFRVLVFTSRCEVCRTGIPPAQERYHCFACSSGDSSPGQWEVCQECYARLEKDARISRENGAGGWRRCLAGHRMAVIGFVAGKDGARRRHVLQDWVGGRRLGFETYHASGLQICYWDDNGQKMERLVTLDVSTTAVDPDADVGVRSRWTDGFPPDGGSGMRAVAKWAWFPAGGAEDELLFPKGAEVREVEDVNGEWFHGVYMGAKGLFPAPYVVPLLDGGL